MAYYLVSAKPKKQHLAHLEEQLMADEFINLKPFGNVLSHSLKNARLDGNGTAWWEEEDYCRPPLKEEKEAVLDMYFDEIEVKRVRKTEGWAQIAELPRLFQIFKNK